MNVNGLQLVGIESSCSELRRIIVSSFPLVSHESSCVVSVESRSSVVCSQPP